MGSQDGISENPELNFGERQMKRASEVGRDFFEMGGLSISGGYRQD